MSEAINRVVPLEKLRWISFGHVEADECGAVNLLLDAAPNTEVVHGALACMVSLIDLCDRPPVVAPEDGVHDIGGHRLRFIPTPHVPHNWEAGLWFDETTSTLLAGDLLTHTGQCQVSTKKRKYAISNPGSSNKPCAFNKTLAVFLFNIIIKSITVFIQENLSFGVSI